MADTGCDYRENGECWTCGCCADPECCGIGDRCAQQVSRNEVVVFGEPMHDPVAWDPSVFVQVDA